MAFLGKPEIAEPFCTCGKSASRHEEEFLLAVWACYVP